MKLNNKLGYDQETTLEYFNQHIFPEKIGHKYLDELKGIYTLYACNSEIDGIKSTHIDTYLSEDKSYWRVQIRETFLRDSFSDYDKWISAIEYADSAGLYEQIRDKTTGELSYAELTRHGIEITYTFILPFIEEMPQFETEKEEKEWVYSLVKWL